jgi:hypothetical protein
MSIPWTVPCLLVFKETKFLRHIDSCKIYDSFDLNPYIHFDFQKKKSIYDLYVYYYWPYAKIL